MGFTEVDGVHTDTGQRLIFILSVRLSIDGLYWAIWFTLLNVRGFLRWAILGWLLYGPCTRFPNFRIEYI